MITLLIILNLLLATAVGVLAWACWRFYRKAVSYDTIFQYLADDVDTNLKQFAKMANSSVLHADHEIQEAHRNMMMMAKRLAELVFRMEEATGLRLRPAPMPPRPKVF